MFTYCSEAVGRMTVIAFLLILWPVCSLGTKLFLFKLSWDWRKSGNSGLFGIGSLVADPGRNWQRCCLGTFQLVNHGSGLEDLAISRGSHD